MKIKINGKTWIVEIVTSRQMKKHRSDGDHLAGLCIPADKAIYIAEDCLSYQTVAHEIFHAYFSDLHLSDTNNIILDDVEEILASHFSDKGQEMIRKSKAILKKLSKKES